jgi:hypothetical protein
VLIWGVARIALAVAVVALYAPVYLVIFQAVRAGAGPEAFQGNPEIMRLQSLSYLINILQIGISSVIWCAVFRSVLHPEQNQFAYMRVGATEFFVAVLLIGAGFVFGIGLVGVILVSAIVIALLAVMHLIWLAVIVGILAAVASFVALIYFGLRFSMVGPMIVEDGKFHLGESWALTRGHVGSLFMIGLLLFVVALLAEIVLVILLVAIGAGALTAIAGGQQNIPTLFQEPPQTLFARLGPVLIIAVVLWIPFVGGLSAIMAAPWARAYRDLQPPDLAATFA